MICKMSSSSHFGGVLHKSGRIGHKIQDGMQFRTAILIERLVRLDIAKATTGTFTDDEISRILKRSKFYLNRLRAKTPYLKKRIELTTGISTSMDDEVNVSIEMQRKYLKSMMPTALRVIADQLSAKPLDTVGKRLQSQLALEVLDREGSFPKISRTDVHQKIEHDFGGADGVSKDLLDAINGTPQRDSEDEAILEILAVNNKFANSETINSTEQEKAMKILEMPSASKEIQ
jgi:hypothetical protein